jgi:hypothetical protein
VTPVFTHIYIDNILVGGLHHWMQPLLLAMTGAILIKGLLTWLQQDVLLTVETRLALGSSGKFFWHVLRLPMEFFAQRFAGEIGSRVEINDRVAAVLATRSPGKRKRIAPRRPVLRSCGSFCAGTPSRSDGSPVRPALQPGWRLVSGASFFRTAEPGKLGVERSDGFGSALLRSAAQFAVSN